MLGIQTPPKAKIYFHRQVTSFLSRFYDFYRPYIIKEPTKRIQTKNSWKYKISNLSTQLYQFLPSFQILLTVIPTVLLTTVN